MNWEEIQEESLKAHIKDFYLYQKILIASPLNEVSFPVLNRKYSELFDSVLKELSKNGFNIKKVPENQSNDRFLESIEGLSAFQLYVTKDDVVFNAPKNLHYMLVLLINSIPTPWS